MTDPLPPDLPADSGRLTAWRVIAVFLAVAAVQLLAGVAVFLAYPEPMRVPDRIPPGLLVASAGAASAIFLVAALAAGTFNAPGAWRALRMTRPGGGWGSCAAAVLAFIPLSHAIDTLLEITGWDDASMLGLMTRSLSQARGMTLVLAVLFIGLGAGIAEECFFRGYMQTWLRRAWGPGRAIVAASAAFALMHFDPIHSPVAFLFGLMLGWIVERTGSIAPAVAAHAANNVLSVLLTALLPGPLPTGVRYGLVPAGLVVAALALLHLVRRRP